MVYCVAARDPSRAEAYAKKHGIPVIKQTYQDVIDDKEVDCVYIPLPNGLHGEWAIKALRAGKHVLLEKPSVSNAADAKKLFHDPLLSTEQAPVILEAFHYRFQPSWRLLLDQIDRDNIEHVETKVSIPGIIFKDDDIRFLYHLAGGTIMDLGTYAISALREVAGEAEECTKCDVQIMSEKEKNVDRCFRAEWKMKNGATAVTMSDIKANKFTLIPPQVTVTHKPVAVIDDSLAEGQTKTRTRSVWMFNNIFPTIYHFITVQDVFVVKDKEGKTVKQWTEKKSLSAYTWDEAGVSAQNDKDYWVSYRHQLEQFVNKVRGRDTVRWISGEDSIRQMEMIDMAYVAAGLPLRPSGDF